jgi:hypothetical protein
MCSSDGNLGQASDCVATGDPGDLVLSKANEGRNGIVPVEMADEGAAMSTKNLPSAGSPAQKAIETKGPIERKRAARMAAWTKKHGKDDAKNPHSRQNSQ